MLTATGDFPRAPTAAEPVTKKKNRGRASAEQHPTRRGAPRTAQLMCNRGHVWVLKAALSHTLRACFGDGCPNTAPLYTLGRLGVFSRVGGRLKLAAWRPVLNIDEVIVFFSFFFASVRFFYFHVFCPTQSELWALSLSEAVLMA